MALISVGIEFLLRQNVSTSLAADSQLQDPGNRVLEPTSQEKETMTNEAQEQSNVVRRLQAR